MYFLFRIFFGKQVKSYEDRINTYIRLIQETQDTNDKLLDDFRRFNRDLEILKNKYVIILRQNIELTDKYNDLVEEHIKVNDACLKLKKALNGFYARNPNPIHCLPISDN
jgi:hypothetical protein